MTWLGRSVRLPAPTCPSSESKTVEVRQRVDLQCHRWQRRHLSSCRVDEGPEEADRRPVGQRESRCRERRVPERLDGRTRLNDFTSREPDPLHALEQRDFAALRNRLCQVVVFGRSPTDLEKHVHHDRRHTVPGQTSNDPGVNVTRRRPVVLRQTQLIQRSLVDADDGDVARRFHGPTHGEQPPEPEFLFEPHPRSRRAEPDPDCGDDDAETEGLSESAHGGGRESISCQASSLQRG